MNAPAAHPHHVLSLRLTTMLRAARACAGATVDTAGMQGLRAASAFACGCMRASRPSRPLLAG